MLACALYLVVGKNTQLSALACRYQYDPNPRVQEAMSGIWKALVDDPKSALDAALPTLMQDLTQVSSIRAESKE